MTPGSSQSPRLKPANHTRHRQTPETRNEEEHLKRFAIIGLIYGMAFFEQIHTKVIPEDHLSNTATQWLMTVIHNT